MNFVGNSMIPMLKTGDALKVVTYNKRKIRAGDVVAFRSPHYRTLTVHRIVKVHSRGVSTKGDNNLTIDAWILHPSDIIGRVDSVKRGNKTITIFGGFPGRMYAMALGAAKRIDLAFSSTFGPAYRWLGKTGIFRNLVSRWMCTRISYFKRREGTELQLLWGRRRIGRLLPGQKRWHIRRPFRLFIDESTLPRAVDIKGKQMSRGAQDIE